jgi:hypothetical protein
VAVGFAAAAVAVAALALLVGPARLVAAFAAVPPRALVILAGIAGAWLFA